MSDTYNPNEIVRCKHLDEFARQLRIKLDGGTDPKPSRGVRFWIPQNPSGGMFAVLNNGIITIPRTISQLFTSNQTHAFRFDENPTNLDTSPVFTLPEGFTQKGTFYSSFSWQFNIILPALVTEPTSFEFDMFLPESLDYKAENFHFVINITN